MVNANDMMAALGFLFPFMVIPIAIIYFIAAFLPWLVYVYLKEAYQKIYWLCYSSLFILCFTSEITRIGAAIFAIPSLFCLFGYGNNVIHTIFWSHTNCKGKRLLSFLLLLLTNVILAIATEFSAALFLSNREPYQQVITACVLLIFYLIVVLIKSRKKSRNFLIFSSLAGILLAVHFYNIVDLFFLSAVKGYHSLYSVPTV